MKKTSFLLLLATAAVMSACFCGCSALKLDDEDRQTLQSCSNSCQGNLNSCQKDLDEISEELEKRQESKPEYQNGTWLDKAIVGVWRSSSSIPHYPYLLILEDSGDCYVAGIKSSWYIKEESLHISISLDDSPQNQKYNEYRYSSVGNKLYLNDNAYIRMNERPGNSTTAAALVGSWKADAPSPDGYPELLTLESNNVGEVDSIQLECLWCTEGNTFYLDTFIEHYSYSFRVENGTLYLNNHSYSKR